MIKSNKELRELDLPQLESEIEMIRREQFKLRILKANNDESIKSKLHHFTQLRRTIARIKTIITEKVGTSR